MQVGQVTQMGPFVLRADSVRVYSREHQGAPLAVEVLFTLGGGNRFDRLDFTETLSRKRRVYLSASSGWRERKGRAGFVLGAAAAAGYALALRSALTLF